MSEQTNPIISFKNFSFQYRAQKKPTLHDINLDIYPGERVLIAGPSGSGKSTLAACINGLNPFSNPGECTGSLTVDGVDAPNSSIFELSAHVGTVLQDPDGQFIGLTVGEDIAFALENSCVPQKEMHEITRHAAELVGIEKRLDHAPHELSGGQKQRVALARALAVEPQILLLDEPFGALDAQVRKELRRWLRQLHEELKFTSVFVTHDQEEATEVADRVVVMSQGNIEQADAPDRVWREPATRFVLEFMGEVNRLKGTLRGGQFHVGAHRWPLGYTPAYQGPVDLFLRPWEVDISRRTSLDSPLPVQVLEASPKGHYTQLVVQPLGWYDEPLTVVHQGEDAPHRGERLFVGLQNARLYNGNERIEPREELALAESA